MPMSSSLMLLDAPDDLFNSPQLSIVFGQDKTLKHPVNDCVLSDLCVWIVASLLFLFCLCFVSVSVSFVWTRLKTPTPKVSTFNQFLQHL